MPNFDLFWNNIKYFSLIVLVAQNAALVLTMRYSRIASTTGKMYLPSTAVVLTELMKLVISLSVVFYNSGYDLENTGRTVYVEIIVKLTETLKVSVPSVLYTIQNNLLYVALSYLNAVTFQVKRNARFVMIFYSLSPSLPPSLRILLSCRLLISSRSLLQHFSQ